MAHWQTARFSIDLTRPRVMGIVNVTPDSFSDGGLHADARAACAHCSALVAEGADILDIGGESTRPGALTPSADEELRRVLPVVQHALSLGVPVSVDTSQPLVIEAVFELGVDIVNDIRALRRDGAFELVCKHPSVGVCLMHMQGEPSSMQAAPLYADVIDEVKHFLAARAAALCERGVDPARIVLDPGIGFGKSVAHNLALLERQAELLDLGYPILAGWSRKSTLGTLTGRAVADRLAGSLAAALAAVQHGARIVRVHDVAATVDALKVWVAAGLVPAGSAPASENRS